MEREGKEDEKGAGKIVNIQIYVLWSSITQYIL